MRCEALELALAEPVSHVSADVIVAPLRGSDIFSGVSGDCIPGYSQAIATRLHDESVIARSDLVVERALQQFGLLGAHSQLRFFQYHGGVRLDGAGKPHAGANDRIVANDRRAA